MHVLRVVLWYDGYGCCLAVLLDDDVPAAVLLRPQRGRRYGETHTLPASETDGYSSSTINVDADAGDGYCIGNVPFMSWVMYAMMILSEFVSFVSGLLFSFSMWRPICRGARYMNDFELPTPRNSGRWSTSCCVTTWNRSRIRCKH